ncbi:LPXTG cell wall anchor domain-containing protein [Streptococcus plurextorum]|uniref:LPXTG cell wall anchor domain-containing protein n=1 Tax=Streptococcus plurextorum TaxID=456876 RepID=UPI00247FED21|nr:LPXTG cell wall anchor domain-containing protein [Streptococcus plurextorum]
MSESHSYSMIPNYSEVPKGSLQESLSEFLSESVSEFISESLSESLSESTSIHDGQSHTAIFSSQTATSASGLLPNTGESENRGLLAGLSMLFGTALFAKKRKKDQE